MFAKYVVPLVLLGISGLLLDSHRRAWRAAQSDSGLSDRDRRFARSQYLRRMQSSSIIGVIGAALACSPLVPAEPVAMAIYLAALGGACAALVLLAFLDVYATRMNLRRIESDQLAAQVKLTMQMRAAASKSTTDEK